MENFEELRYSVYVARPKTQSYGKDRMDWVEQNIGRHGEFWEVKADSVGIQYWFKNEADLMLFILRWK